MLPRNVSEMTKVCRYVNVCYSNMNKTLDVVIRMCIMQENYHSGDNIFSLFGFRGKPDTYKNIQLMTEPFELS